MFVKDPKTKEIVKLCVVADSNCFISATVREDFMLDVYDNKLLGELERNFPIELLHLSSSSIADFFHSSCIFPRPIQDFYEKYKDEYFSMEFYMLQASLDDIKKFKTKYNLPIFTRDIYLTFNK